MQLQLVLEPHADVSWLIQEAVRGGVTSVQWRDKFYNDRDFYERALIVRNVCKELGVPLIVNDRVDVALAIEADGVHLGQSDLPYEIARRVLHKNMTIGWTAETFEDIERAKNYELSYLAISPLFPTHTKTDTKTAFGLDGLRKARAMTKHTLIAIGGINAENVNSVFETGADGIAVVSAICRAHSPYEAARSLKR